MSTDDQLERALEWVDPEIVLLVPDRDGDADADLDTVLRLLHDVPAGKLAVAAVAVTTRRSRSPSSSGPAWTR